MGIVKCWNIQKQRNGIVVAVALVEVAAAAAVESGGPSNPNQYHLGRIYDYRERNQHGGYDATASAIFFFPFCKCSVQPC